MCRQMGFSGDLLSEVGPSTATLSSTLVLFTLQEQVYYTAKPQLPGPVGASVLRRFHSSIVTVWDWDQNYFQCKSWLQNKPPKY